MADSILSRVVTGACHFDLDDSNMLGVLREGGS